MYTVDDHTFVVCAYKESPYLDECIASLVSQTVPSTVLVATSTPNSHIVSCAEHYGLPVHVSPGPSGICQDWNYAASQATTPLVTIAHQDDVYSHSYKEHMLSSLNAADDPLIFFTNYGELRDSEKVLDNTLLRIKRTLLAPIARTGFENDEKRKRRLLSIGSSICCPSVTLNVPLLPNPPFQSEMKSNLDWDTWERYSHIPGSFVYDPEILMYHRVHEASTTSALIHDNIRSAEDLEMLKRFWPSPVARAINLVYSQGQRSNG